MTLIREILIESNPWWRGKFVLDYKDREIYREILDFLKYPQIIALTGLRRVGKTTLMLKVVEDFISKGFDPSNIFYFSFDELRDVRIMDILHEYELLLRKNLKKGKYLVLFDEIQKLSNWGDQLKRVYDTYKGYLNIIISGSESLFIKTSRDTLAGRMFEFRIDTLSFKEFLGFKSVDVEPLELHERELSGLLEEFTLSLGFPELVGISDRRMIKKYVQESIIERVIYKDIAQLFRLKDFSILESILNILMVQPGQIIELSSLANELNVSRQSISQYITYLELSFLVKKIYNFSRSRRKVERKLKKYYPTVPSVNLIFRDDPLSRSMIFEWLIIMQLHSDFFWRDPYKNEVDIVLTIDDKLIPIEVKHSRITFDGLLKFMKRFDVKHGFVISKNTERVEKINNKVIYIVPAYKFLLKREELLHMALYR